MISFNLYPLSFFLYCPFNKNKILTYLDSFLFLQCHMVFVKHFLKWLCLIRLGENVFQDSLPNLQKIFIRHAGLRTIHPTAFYNLKILIEAGCEIHFFQFFFFVYYLNFSFINFNYLFWKYVFKLLSKQSVYELKLFFLKIDFIVIIKTFFL